MLGEYEAAVEDARSTIRRCPVANPVPDSVLASALGHLDRREEAKVALDRVLEIQPDFTPDGVMAVISPLDPDAMRPLARTWFAGLRKAGLDIPDEPPGSD